MRVEIPVFLILDMHVQNKKYENSEKSRLTGKCAAQQNKKNFCSSSLWTCLHNSYGHIKNPESNHRFYLMILA